MEEVRNCSLVKIKTKHNGIISFWKFMFSIMIIVFHCARLATPGERIFCQYGAIGVEFFFLVSGYLMARRVINDNSEINNLGKESIQFVWKKYKGFFPYILVAFIISLIVNTIIEGYNKSEIINSIWYLFLLQITGIRSTQVMGPTWYISAMLVAMLILYPLMRKYKKNFIYLIAPLIVLFVGGWISHNYGKLGDPLEWTGIVNKGLLRALFELSLGAILYELTEKLKKINFTKFSQFILTIVEEAGFASIFVITNTYDASHRYDFIMLFILCISVTLAFSEKTLLLKFASNKYSHYLQNLSLPIYLNHLWIRAIVEKHLWFFSYKKKTVIIIFLAIIISALILYFTKKFMEKLNENKQLIKRIFIRERKIEDD